MNLNISLRDGKLKQSRVFIRDVLVLVVTIHTLPIVIFIISSPAFSLISNFPFNIPPPLDNDVTDDNYNMGFPMTSTRVRRIWRGRTILAISVSPGIVPYLFLCCFCTHHNR